MFIYQLQPSDIPAIAPLFAGWEESLIWSCLQGCMGEAWADRKENPESARIILGDFCYLAGKVTQGLSNRSQPKEALILLLWFHPSKGAGTGQRR